MDGNIIYLKDRPTKPQPEYNKKKDSMNKTINTLDDSKGGIPATGGIKNRHSLLIISRDDYDLERITDQMSDMLTDLLEDTIDTFTVDVKMRTW